MSSYFLKFPSFEFHSAEIIKSVLNLPIVSKFIFPAKIYVDKDSSIKIPSVDQFNLSEFCKPDEDELSWSVNLYTDSEMRFSFRIYKEDRGILVSPHTIGLRFSESNFQNGAINIAVIKSLFKEIIPIFKPYGGTLYEEYTSLRLLKTDLYHDFCVQVNEKPYVFEAAWVSYCGPAQLKFAGRKRFQNLRNCLETYDLHDGLMIVLQEDPYDDSNFIHRQRLEALIHELNFEELVVK